MCEVRTIAPLAAFGQRVLRAVGSYVAFPSAFKAFHGTLPSVTRSRWRHGRRSLPILLSARIGELPRRMMMLTKIMDIDGMLLRGDVDYQGLQIPI